MKNEENYARRIWRLLLILYSAFGILPLPAADSPREDFNAGTQQLRAGKLDEAERLLQIAVGEQDEYVQPTALYNLGLVRVAQGAESLKKSPAAGPTAARGAALATLAEDASQRIDDAVASQNMEQMIAAYVRGRGIHRELREAAKAVKQALEKYGATLNKWQRASGDFKSAAELNPADADAQANADATDRAIAKLVDQLDQLQQAAARMAGAGPKLGDKLKKLKGLIPAPDMPPGASGGEEEDEDGPFGLKPGQQEGASRSGEEMKMSPEEAQQLLDGYKLGGDRPLPMGPEAQGRLKTHTGKNW